MERAERLISRLAASVHHIGRGSTDPRKWQRQDSSWKPAGMPTGDSVYLGVVYRCSYLAGVMTGCDMRSVNLLRKIAQVYHSRQDKSILVYYGGAFHFFAQASPGT